MKFDVFGPYEIHRFTYRSGKLITKESIAKLKVAVDKDNDSICAGCGCYVFAIRAAHGFTPWYVGQASKMRLLDESMNPNNREKYNKIIAKRVGTPVMFFIPKLTKGGQFAKPTKKESGELRAVNFLEEWLIASALQKNPGLLNQKKTHFLKNLHVVGIFNPKPGESHARSQALSRALF